MKIGIITAMSSEQKQLASQLENKTERKEGPFTYVEGNIRSNTVVLMQCGIGKVNAAVGAVEMIRNFHPDCIISTGVAGGYTCLSSLRVSSVYTSPCMYSLPVLPPSPHTMQRIPCVFLCQSVPVIVPLDFLSLFFAHTGYNDLR